MPRAVSTIDFHDIFQREQTNTSTPLSTYPDSFDSDSLVDSLDSGNMNTLAFHQIGPGSIPGVDAICGLTLLLELGFFEQRNDVDSLFLLFEASFVKISMITKLCYVHTSYSSREQKQIEDRVNLF